jgi:tetratricopeptide (TPR) repeat protein
MYDLTATETAARQAQARADWVAATALWQRCLDAAPQHARVALWRSKIAQVLLAQNRFAEAEAEYGALTRDYPRNPAGYAGQARVAAARGEWNLVVERWDECLRRFPADDASPVRREQRAQALMRAGRFDEAEQAFCALTKDFPDLLAGFAGQAQLATHRGQYESALRCWAHFADRHPRAIEPYEGCVEAADGAGDLESALSIIRLAPMDLADCISFKCRVWLQIHRRWRQIEPGLTIVSELDPTSIDRPCTIEVCTFFLDNALFHELEVFAGTSLLRFPAERWLINYYLRATRLSSGAAKFDTERARLLSALPESVAASILSALQPNWLPTADIKRAIDWTITAQISDEAKASRLAYLSFHPDPASLAYLAKRLGEDRNPAFMLLERLLLTMVRDQRRIAHANLGGVTWNEFADEARALNQDIAILFAAADAGRLPPRFLETATRLERVCQKSSAAWIATGESWSEAASVAAWLRHRISERMPTSVIRLGDGEGHFLPYAPGISAFKRQDQRKILHQWWGADVLSDAQIRDLESRFETAIGRADAVGVQPLRRHLAITLEDRFLRGVCNPINFLESRTEDESKRRILLSLHLPSDLDRWDLWREILTPLSSVSVISCLDLSRILAERFGISVRLWYRIPPVHYYRTLLAEPGREPERPFYPDVFEEIMANVAPKAGELFLVAAGFLGKLLCDQIRERGGIGFDIGSQADSWKGHATRIYTGAELEFDSASSLIEGQPFTDQFDAQRVSVVEPCRSDRTRRVNLTGRFDALFTDTPAAPKKADYALRIIGHPGCGSAYVARTLTSLGVLIGHERPEANGICGWSCSVEDLTPVFDTPYIPTSAFHTTLAFVRDPTIAIPCIIVENCNDASFSFRRFHIARLLGVDIARRRDPIERAVESYLRWMQIVDQQRPRVTLHVERLREDLLVHKQELEAAGVFLNWELVDGTGAERGDIDESMNAHDMPLPTIAPDRYQRLPEDLREALSAFCSRYGYRLPAEWCG